MVVALTETNKSGGKADQGDGRGFCFKCIKFGTKKKKRGHPDEVVHPALGNASGHTERVAMATGNI